LDRPFCLLGVDWVKEKCCHLLSGVLHHRLSDCPGHHLPGSRTSFLSLPGSEVRQDSPELRGQGRWDILQVQEGGVRLIQFREGAIDTWSSECKGKGCARRPRASKSCSPSCLHQQESWVARGPAQGSTS
jgi:hypothetical protein